MTRAGHKTQQTILMSSLKKKARDVATHQTAQSTNFLKMGKHTSNSHDACQPPHTQCALRDGMAWRTFLASCLEGFPVVFT